MPLHDNFSHCPNCGKWHRKDYDCQGFPKQAQNVPELTATASEAKKGDSLAILEGSLYDVQPAGAYIGAEKDLHNEFEKDMRRRGCVTIHCQTNKAATIGRGKPDFHILFTGKDGICRACAVEFKTAGNKPSDVQREEIADMRSRNVPVLVAWTLADAISFCRKSLGC